MEQPQNSPEKPKINLYDTSNNSKELESLLKGMDETKEKFETPAKPLVKPEEPAIANTQNPDDKTPAGNEGQKPVRDPAKVGKAYFTITDKPLRLLAGWIADESMSQFKLPDEDQKELIEAWTEIAQDNNWKKPPAWLTILIIIVVGYGFMLYTANNIRVQKKKKAIEDAEKAKKLQEKPDHQIEESETKTDFFRACPKCGIKIYYSGEQSLKAAIEKGTYCKICRADKTEEKKK